MWGNVRPSSAICPNADVNGQCSDKYHIVSADRSSVTPLSTFKNADNIFSTISLCSPINVIAMKEEYKKQFTIQKGTKKVDVVVDLAFK